MPTLFSDLFTHSHRQQTSLVQLSIYLSPPQYIHISTKYHSYVFISLVCINRIWHLFRWKIGLKLIVFVLDIINYSEAQYWKPLWLLWGWPSLINFFDPGCRCGHCRLLRPFYHIKRQERTKKRAIYDDYVGTVNDLLFFCPFKAQWISFEDQKVTRQWPNHTHL